jgi:hypothetical protein
MTMERLQLVGWDRARYFMPTVICLYLTLLCLGLVVTSAFLANLQNTIAVAAAGLFGVLLSGGLGLALWAAQRRDLRYVTVETLADAAANFEIVQAAALGAGWRIVRADPGRRLEACTSVLLLDEGERVAVQFRGRDVLVASICDPSVGFSLVGRRHCGEHRELVRRAVVGEL